MRNRAIVLFAAVSVAAASCTSAPTPAATAPPAAPSAAPATVVPAAAGSVTAAGSMLRPRAAHTETALRDGRVLIVGGFGDAGGDEASAELYHPRGRRFTFTGRMSVGRQSHTATLLAAGSVLVAGGYDPSGRRLATAELYDPATGRFSPTGSMRGPRADHTATLLTDGRVLVTGGTGPGFTFLATAEIYDPRTGTFSATGSMSVPRESATATLLRDGRVLIAGGHAGRHADITIYASSEIYDPATGRFTRSGDMTIPRHKHDAVRLNDGRVLIVGGSDARDDHGLYASAELFDPSTDTFSPAGSLLEGRYKMRGTSLLLADGTALVCCGAARAEAFDPATDRFSALSGNLGIGPLFAAAARIGPRSVLVTGGYSLSGPATNLAWILRG